MLFLPPAQPTVSVMPPWLVLSLAVAGPALFRAGVGPSSRLAMGWAIPHPLCLGVGCEVTRSMLFDNDPRMVGTSNARFLGGLGALPAAALALFMMPEARKANALALRVGPMFTLHGAGLELRFRW